MVNSYKKSKKISASRCATNSARRRRRSNSINSLRASVAINAYSIDGLVRGRTNRTSTKQHSEIETKKNVSKDSTSFKKTSIDKSNVKVNDAAVRTEEIKNVDIYKKTTKPNIADYPMKKGVDKKKQRSKKYRATSFLKALIVLLELGTGVLAFLSIMRINILSLKYLCAVALVMLVLLFLTSFKIIRKKTKLPIRIASIFLAILLSTVYIIGAYYIDQTATFIERVTTTSNIETEEYSVVILKDSSFEEIEDLSGSRIGFQRNNTHLELAEKGLSEVINFTPEYGELGLLIANLESGELSGIAIATTYLGILHDEQNEIYEKLKVIYTFEIEYQRENTTSSETDISNEPFIIYISGIDSRGKLSAVGRSDVNMLAVVNPRINKILLVSVPRDYYVQLHGTTGIKDKLTHAGIYGIDISRQTMEDLFGISIQHTLKVGFSAVETIVNEIDGIDIYSDRTFIARADKTCRFVTGTQHVNGKCALAFARERYAYANGDRHRIENQQAVLTKIFEKMSQVKYLSNYSNILASMEGTFSTSLSYNEITNFVKRQIDSMKKWSIESISLDGTGSMLPTYSMGSQQLYVMIPDEATVSAAKTKISEYLEVEKE